ncbi:MAG: hypothetical protein KC636_36075, partial [Myxococcales bacterium]|nr:hypothetical protein [Myxococcales bacterium]
MRPGDALETEPAARLSDAGDGVARAGSLQVHVPGLFVGERARVVVEHASRQAPRAHARLVELLVEAPGRRSPPCRHHEARGGRCTGCPLMPLAEPAQEAQRLATLRARFGAEVDLSFHTSPSRALGYRMSSKRVAFGAPGELRLGSFRRGSHEPADMADCLVDHPEIAAAARELAAVASDLGLTPYHDHAGAPAEGGDLRHVWLKTDGARVVVTLITASDESEAARRLPGRLTRADGLAWCVQADAGNTVRGHGLTVIHGDVALALQLADVTVHPGPLGFLQPNPEVAALAYRELVAGPDGQPRAGALDFDLYAGAGVTT